MLRQQHLLLLEMPQDPQFLVDFEEEKLYHVTCKTVAKRVLFTSDDNKNFFLKRYKNFLLHFADTFAYNLLKNHVHLIIKTKTAEEITNHLLKTEELTPTQQRFLNGTCSFHELIEQQFHRLFISYSLAFNKQQNLHGHLFNRPFRRTEIEDLGHFIKACVYIHANNHRHGFKNDFTKYKWSSYQAIIGNKPTDIKRNEILYWFGGIKNFIELHEALAADLYNWDWED